MIVEVLEERNLAKGTFGKLNLLENLGYHFNRQYLTGNFVPNGSVRHMSARKNHKKLRITHTTYP